MAKKTPHKKTYPKIVFVEDVSPDKDFTDVLISDTPEGSLADDEECEVAIYEFKRVVRLVRQSKVVVEEL